MLRNAEVWQQRTSHSTNVNYSKRRVCVCLLSVCVCCCCDLFRDVAIGNKTHSNSIFYSNFERERQRVRERSVPANSPQRERQGKHESAIIQSTDCVCECGFWFETEKRGKFYKRATFCYVFASVVCVCVWNSECMCVCASVCVVASFWLWRAEVRQQRIAVSVATFSFVSPMPIIIERTLVCLSLCLSFSLSLSLSLSHNKKQDAKAGLSNISLFFSFIPIVVFISALLIT